MENKQGIGFFEKYLTIWVALCIIIGIAVGQWLPAIPQTLSKFEYANVSIPVAILIWLMIYPMMLKVDFQSVKNVGKRDGTEEYAYEPPCHNLLKQRGFW